MLTWQFEHARPSTNLSDPGSLPPAGSGPPRSRRSVFCCCSIARA